MIANKIKDSREEIVNANTSTHSINLKSKEISKGLYFLHIGNEDDYIMKKIIKN